MGAPLRYQVVPFALSRCPTVTSMVFSMGLETWGPKRWLPNPVPVLFNVDDEVVHVGAAALAAMHQVVRANPQM